MATGFEPGAAITEIENARDDEIDRSQSDCRVDDAILQSQRLEQRIGREPQANRSRQSARKRKRGANENAPRKLLRAGGQNRQ